MRHLDLVALKNTSALGVGIADIVLTVGCVVTSDAFIKYLRTGWAIAGQHDASHDWPAAPAAGRTAFPALISWVVFKDAPNPSAAAEMGPIAFGGAATVWFKRESA
jgi:hypothetical protein